MAAIFLPSFEKRRKADLRLNELVNQVLQEFLAATGVCRFTSLQGISLELLEAHFPVLDLGANAGIPGTISFFGKFRQTPIPADCRRDFQAARERIHPANVSIKQVD